MCKKSLAMLVVASFEGRGDGFSAGEKRERPRSPEADSNTLNCTSERIDGKRGGPAALESSARLA
jgi:hypothetical protein